MTERMTAAELRQEQVLAWTEAELQTEVIRLAKETGWLVHHTRPARMKDGQWRTPIQGDKGFPDLVMARLLDIVFIELKSEKGRLTPEQSDWVHHLGPAFCFVWRPSDWLDGTIQGVLA